MTPHPWLAQGRFRSIRARPWGLAGLGDGGCVWGDVVLVAVQEQEGCTGPEQPQERARLLLESPGFLPSPALPPGLAGEGAQKASLAPRAGVCLEAVRGGSTSPALCPHEASIQQCVCSSALWDALWLQRDRAG